MMRIFCFITILSNPISSSYHFEMIIILTDRILKKRYAYIIINYKHQFIFEEGIAAQYQNLGTRQKVWII